VLAAVLDVPGEPPEVREHPDPAERPGHTLVSVTAAPIVPLDQLAASGRSYFCRPAAPYVPGTQGVGVVDRSAVLPAGTRIFFWTSAGMAPGDGSMAERAACADADLVPLPDGVDDVPFAALGLSGVAAWMILTWRARMQRGEQVLVLGAGGAVGQAAVGTARLLGARRVVAVARSEAARERALAAGADRVLPLDADVDALTGALRDACPDGADVVVDPVFGTAATAAARVLAPGGRLVNLGGASGDVAEFSSAVLRSRSAEVLGYTNNALTPDQRRTAVTEVARALAAGQLAVAHERVPFESVSEAWRRQASDPGVRLVLSP
jgi:NADPH:quinone reductase-like Zn-dependent oxidoreductase